MMVAVTLLLSVILSVFSTAVMSYIAMAVPIGPWMAPTLVLIALFVLKAIGKSNSSQSIALATISGSIGGILATAVGFSFPTLFFLDPQLFNEWMAHRTFFSLVLTGLSVAAGSFGFWIANLFEDKLLVQEKLAFPIGQLVHKMICATNQIKKAYELMIGFVGTTVFCVLQDGLWFFKGLVPKTVTLLQSASIGVIHFPMIQFDLWPMVWAIGFITGHVIAIPLAVGAAAKIGLVDPINSLIFPALSSIEFIFVFCSGMVFVSTIQSFVGLPKVLSQVVKRFFQRKDGQSLLSKVHFSWIEVVQAGVLIGFSFIFLTYFEFSLLSQLFLLVATFIFTYQVLIIAGKIGLAPFPRFATFVMIPAMFLFRLNFIQIVLISTFVQICAGIAVDVLFGRKIAQLANIDRSVVKRYQFLGLLVGSLCIGIVFWLLIDACQLGSAQLFAYKAKARQLLINTLLEGTDFNLYVLLIGGIFSFILQKLKVNPMLVLGGLLMPFNLSIGLIFGGLLSLFSKDKQEWEPFWSGVFASNSIWMIIQAMRP